MSALANLLLAGLGLPVVVGGVAVVARGLVYADAERNGRAYRARGAAEVHRAEVDRIAEREREAARSAR